MVEKLLRSKKTLLLIYVAFSRPQGVHTKNQQTFSILALEFPPLSVDLFHKSIASEPSGLFTLFSVLMYSPAPRLFVAKMQQTSPQARPSARREFFNAWNSPSNEWLPSTEAAAGFILHAWISHLRDPTATCGRMQQACWQFTRSWSLLKMDFSVNLLVLNPNFFRQKRLIENFSIFWQYLFKKGWYSTLELQKNGGWIRRRTVRRRQEFVNDVFDKRRSC